MITLCCVAFNEESRIEDFIKYHSSYFDDIVILNQGSTDNTEKIISKYPNVKILHDRTRGIAEPSRHICALNAKNDWILFLDADEYASQDLLKNLNNYINSEYTGYILGRDNYHNDKHISYEVNQYRLFKKQYVVFGTVLHSGIIPGVGAKVGTIEHAIEHKKNSEEHSIDHESYKTIIEKMPENINPFWYNVYLSYAFPLEKLISFVVTTSAKHSNPSIEHIERMFDSYDKNFGTTNIPKVLVADGFNKERNINNKSYNILGMMDEQNYNVYKENLRQYCNKKDILFIELKENKYMFGAMLEGTKRISTPFYLFSPDDIIAKREVNLKDIITGMSKVLEIKRLQFLDYEIHQTDWHKTLVQSKTDEFPYVKTSCWSGNTHIGYTFHYNYIYGTKQEELKQYPLELVMHDEYQKLIERNGFDHAYSIYGCCIYGTIGDSAVVEHDFSYANKEKTVRYHSYDFPDGTKAVGSLSTELLNTQFEWLGDIDFKDKSVIDIGCWDGFYSIKAKQKGARSVLGIDINPWGKSDWIANFREAVKKFGFNPVDIDCRYEDLFELDCYWEKRDIVLFMGVLYHLQEPLSALYRLRNLTREKLVIETLIDGDDLPFPALKFYPGKEMGNDPTNWFGPNKLWIESALKVVGFDDVKLIHEHGNRAVYHAS